MPLSKKVQAENDPLTRNLWAALSSVSTVFHQQAAFMARQIERADSHPRLQDIGPIAAGGFSTTRFPNRSYSRTYGEPSIMQQHEEQKDRQAAGKNTSAGFEALGLSAEDIGALKRQGSVAKENRGDRTVYKLRWRVAAKQRTKYLGTDLAGVNCIQEQLRQHQSICRIKKQLRDLGREGRAVLRETKLRLQPLLEEIGLAFHGWEIRRPRRRRKS